MDFNGKKVLMVTTTDNMIWQFLIPHIQYLQEQGAVVSCVCAKTGFWFDELKDKFGFEMHEINFKRNPFHFSNIKCFKKLKALQNEKHFDLVYCQQPVGGLMGRLIAKKYKIPCIYTAHGFHFFKGCSIQNKLIYKTVEKWLSKYTDVLVTINDEDYNAALKMKAKKVYKINGIGMNFDKYSPIEESRSEIRKSLNLNENDFAVVTIAEFIKRKNYATMLKTFKLINEPNIKLFICGRGKLEKQIKNYIERNDLKTKVEILGYRKDINRILTAADCFFLPSFQEGLTLSVIEAMSYGLPCVVSDVRGNRDLIENEIGGYVAAPKDASTYAQKLTYLFKNKETATRMGQNNKKSSLQYDIKYVKNQLEEIYKEM